MRRWFIFYLLYLSALAGTALYSLGTGGQNSDQSLAGPGLIGLYLFYMSVCCTFFPAPTAWIVLLMASPMIGVNFAQSENLYLQAVSTVVAVAAVGAFGTAMANLNEYHIFTFLLRFGRVYRLRNNRLYQTARKWFEVSPFALMTTMSFLPIPVDVVRWLAITHRYNRGHYFLAGFLGRLIRYSLLAATATVLKMNWLGILIVQVALILLVLLRYLPRLIMYFKYGTGLRNNEQINEEVISA